MTMKPVTDETLKLKTWVLKVSIDCQGCKKKVQKILKGVQGVYGTVVDAEHNKVTVTGDVDADTLISKLAKSGKHAELIPQEKKKPSKNEKQSNSKVNDSVRKAENVSVGPKTVSKEAEETNDVVEKQRKKQRKKKSGKKMSDLPGDGGETMTVVGSPVSTLQSVDPTAYHGYPMSTLPPLDPTAYHAHPVNPYMVEYEDQKSGCFIM